VAQHEHRESDKDEEAEVARAGSATAVAAPVASAAHPTHRALCPSTPLSLEVDTSATITTLGRGRGGSYDGGMATWRRPAAWAATLLLSGCTYSAEEPSLLPSPRQEPTGSAQSEPPPTNPMLPVAGERLWVSGWSALPITMRIALHAVRRIDGATVVDWSITPISAPGYDVGAALPPTELALEGAKRRTLGLALIDPATGRAYQPLEHKSERQFHHCLCVPMLRLQPDLRVGETRLLQAAFPSLPKSLSFVDVSLLSVAPFRHVPVSAIGTAPAARRPTDLARPGKVPPPGPGRIDFANPKGSKQRQRIEVTRVLAAPGRATLEWQLTSLDDQAPDPVLGYGPPVASTPADGIDMVNTSPANGAVLRIGSTRLTNLWNKTTVDGRTAYACQCTEIDQWASGLREQGVSVGLVTSYPALPGGTRSVKVEFPGSGVFRVPVVPVEDAAALVVVKPAQEVLTGRWTYLGRPASGWPTSEWPTPTPDEGQLVDYAGAVEPLITLPTAR
jgi:hypothetical protein